MPRQGFFSPTTTHEQEDIEVSDDEASWGFLDQPVNPGRADGAERAKVG